MVSTHRFWCKPVRILISFKVKEKALSAISCLFMVMLAYLYFKPVSFTGELTVNNWETLDTQYCFYLGDQSQIRHACVSMRNRTPEVCLTLHCSGAVFAGFFCHFRPPHYWEQYSDCSAFFFGEEVQIYSCHTFFRILWNKVRCHRCEDDLENMNVYLLLKKCILTLKQVDSMY